MNYFFGLIIVGLVVKSQSVPPADGLEKRDGTIDRKWLSKILQLFPEYPGGEESYARPSEQLRTHDVYSHVNDELMTININYTNNVLYGLEFAIDNESISANNLRLYFNAFCDRIEFVGDYAAAGRISGISIHGAGRSNITMLDVNTENTVLLERYEKDGKEFFRVTEYEIKLDPRQVRFEYSGLVLDNFMMRQSANRIINENWKAFFESTTKGPLEENFGALFKVIGNEACSWVPVN